MDTNKTNGFTLIELMIAVAVIGILAAIAFPSYQQYRVRENRTEMKTTMTEIAQRLAAHKLANSNYSTATVTNIYGASVYPQTGTKIYDVGLVVTASTWVLTALPAGQQVGNGSLVLNDQGWSCWVKTSDTACTPASGTSWDGN